MIGKIVGCGVPSATRSVLDEVEGERLAQDVRWGRQDHPDGTGVAPIDRTMAQVAQSRCEIAFENGRGTYRHILDEEVAEAFAESDPARLRAELIQVAAVAVAWVEAIDRRERNDVR